MPNHADERLTDRSGTRRHVAVVTSSRADYGHLYWPLKELNERANVRTSLIVTGAHLSPEFGHTVDEIVADGFDVAERIECLLSSDTDVGMAKTIGAATMSFADVLGRLRPDLLLVIADRYEMLAPASAALALRIPLAHIEGGDISEGAIDHAVRNALTMMSHLHFTPTDAARRRVLSMGEESWRVHHVGSPSLDHLRRRTLPGRESLETRLDMSLDPAPLVVGYHPVTLYRDSTREADAVFAALTRVRRPIVFCFPNADAGSRAIIERATRFCDERSDARLCVNLPHLEYWGLLSHARAMCGNSSSGIMEAPSIGLPSVNVGIRQRGRERATSVIDVRADADSISDGLERALDDESFRAGLAETVNPYGDGDAGRRIADVIATCPLGEQLLIKQAMCVDVSLESVSR